MVLPARAVPWAAAAAVVVSGIQACSGAPASVPPQQGLPHVKPATQPAELDRATKSEAQPIHWADDQRKVARHNSTAL
jgi:hypothetical protein